MIPDSFKQELLHRVDVVDVIERYVPLKKGGANYLACCPFHGEKTPSFTVSPSKQFYHCFGCGAHGNAISFLMEYQGLGYVDAVKDLAESAGMRMPEFEPRSRKPEPGADLHEIMQRACDYYREQLKASPRAIEYLKGRGLTGKIAARFGIGYAPDGWQNLEKAFPDYADKALKDAGLVIDSGEGRRYDRFRDRIMFPILDQRGSVVAFGGRVLGEGGSAGSEAKGSAGPKYLNSPETQLFEKGRELYGLTQARAAIRAAGRAIVVEGYMDAVALAQHGIEQVVATLGTATSATHVQKLLRQTDEVVFCFDGDAAGRKAAWHALEVSLSNLADHKTIRFLFLPPEHDPDSFVREEGREAFEEKLGEARPLSEFFLDELKGRGETATAEGRSRLIHEAKPLLKQVSAPTLQLQLLKSVAEAAAMTQEEAARLTELRVARAGVQASGRPARARDERAPMQSLEIWLLKRLIVMPSLAEQVPVDRIRGDTLESRALHAFIEFGRKTSGGNFDALLIDRFQGTEFEGLFKQMQKEAMVLNLTPEQVTGEFRDALPNLERRHVRERLAALQREAESRGLDAEEMSALTALTKRLSELDRHRTPPVL